MNLLRAHTRLSMPLMAAPSLPPPRTLRWWSRARWKAFCRAADCWCSRRERRRLDITPRASPSPPLPLRRPSTPLIHAIPPPLSMSSGGREDLTGPPPLPSPFSPTPICCYDRPHHYHHSYPFTTTPQPLLHLVLGPNSLTSRRPCVLDGPSTPSVSAWRSKASPLPPTPAPQRRRRPSPSSLPPVSVS